jgi:hypothetical protein
MKAFPTPAFSISDEARVTAVGGEGGMELRDYFAAKAMQGLITHEQKASHLSGANIGDFDVRVAFAAYRYADAMMSRREA